MLNNFVRQVRNWKQQRTSYDALARMSDRELDDIGVNRVEVAQFAPTALR